MSDQETHQSAKQAIRLLIERYTYKEKNPAAANLLLAIDRAAQRVGKTINIAGLGGSAIYFGALMHNLR